MITVYFGQKGHTYLGYRLCFTTQYNKGDYRWIPDDTTVALTPAVSYTLRTSITDLLDNSISSVPKGSSVFVSPNSPVPIDDIRNNYSRKIKVDTGDYNVFSPLKEICKTTYFAAYAVIPAVKTIVMHNLRVSTSDAVASLRSYVETFFQDCDYTIVEKSGDIELYEKINECYLKLLDGTLTKPCVSIDKLNLTAPNVLTSECLRLVYIAGMKPCQRNSDAVHAFNVQLGVLNQYNWREYPGAISLLFNEIMKTKMACPVSWCRYYKSMQNKLVQQFIKHPFTLAIKKEDVELCQQLISDILDLGNRRFVDFASLAKKLEDKNISPATFNIYYSSIVKLDRISVENA